MSAFDMELAEELADGMRGYSPGEIVTGYQAALDEIRRLRNERDWEPTRWYRVLNVDGSVWCESSYPAEVREAVAAIRQPVQQLYREIPRSEWRPE